LKDYFGRETAAFSANEGDNTIGTAGIAAVLNLECGAGVIPFPAEDRGGEKFGAIENVASEDLAKLRRSILSAALRIKVRS